MQEWNATRCDPDSIVACGESTYGITNYKYDALGRMTLVIPPDGTASSNNVATLYSGNSTTVTDQAGKQRRSYMDVLGRLVQVDEPGTVPVAGTPSSATATLSGTERFVPDPSVPATSGSATISITGSDRSTIVGAHPATASTGSITVQGTQGSITMCDPDIVPLPNKPCIKITVKDTGTVTLRVNGVAYQASYGPNSTTASIATGVYNAINANTTGPAINPVVLGSTVTFASRASGATVNYALTSSTTSNDPGDFGPTGWFSTTLSGPTMTGGADAFGGTPTNDTGSITISVNGVSKSANYDQSSTPTTLATALAGLFHGDVTSPVDAVSSAGAVTVTARVKGAGTNYALTTTAATNNANFTGTSFNAGSGAALTGGRDQGTVGDRGTVTITVNGFPGSAAYDQASTTTSIAAGLASALSAAGSPVQATSLGATITMTSRTPGAVTNYTLSASSATTLPASFTGSSYSAGLSGGAMTGGTDPTFSAPSLNTPWTTLYAYDVLGNLTCVEQHGGVNGTGCSSPATSDATSPWRVRRFTYDSLSQLLTAKNPESGTIAYGYNDDGVMVSKTDGRGVTITYNPAESPIDPLHRVTKKTYSNGEPAVTYSYDNPAVPESIGQRTAMTDISGSTNWTYDNMGRPLTEVRKIGGITKTSSMQYSLGGFLEKLTYPTGTVVQFMPSSAGHTLEAKDLTHSITYATGAQFAPGGQLTDVVLGGAIRGKFSFNSRLQPLHLLYTTGALPSSTELAAPTCATSVTGSLMDRVYGFGFGSNDDGNVNMILNCRDANRTQNFTYDTLNRVSQAFTSGPNWGESFAIDAWGNLTARTQITGKTSFEPLSAPATLLNRISVLSYDTGGNLLSGPSGSANSTYDAENRINSSGIWAYLYDGDGERVMKKMSGAVNKLYWRPSGSEVLAESDGSGTVSEEYVFFNGQRIGRREVATGTVEYYLSDHLGTASVIATSIGGNKEESDYYPYGGEISLSGADANNYKFTGKERDAETGLDYFGARYYGSNLGRFTSPDWSDAADAVPFSNLHDPQSLNLYGYVRNIPTTNVDLDGHGCPPECTVEAIEGLAEHPEVVTEALEGVERATIAVAEGAGEKLASASSKVGGLLGRSLGVIGLVIGNPLSLNEGEPVPVRPEQAEQQQQSEQEQQPTPSADGAGSKKGGGRRAGDFTPSHREQIIQDNATKNGGTNICESCGQPLVRTQNKSKTSPPANQLHVHHNPPIHKGGGRHSKGEVLCKKCHIKWHKKNK